MLEGLDGSASRSGCFVLVWRSSKATARGAAAHLAGLPEPTTRRARVERSVLLALSVVDRDVEWRTLTSATVSRPVGPSG